MINFTDVVVFTYVMFAFVIAVKKYGGIRLHFKQMHIKLILSKRALSRATRITIGLAVALDVVLFTLSGFASNPFLTTLLPKSVIATVIFILVQFLLDQNADV